MVGLLREAEFFFLSVPFLLAHYLIMCSEHPGVFLSGYEQETAPSKSLEIWATMRILSCLTSMQFNDTVLKAT